MVVILSVKSNKTCFGWEWRTQVAAAFWQVFFFFFLQNFCAIQYQLVPPEQHTQAVVCSTMLRPLQCRGMLMQLLVSKVLLIKSFRGPLLYEEEYKMWTGKVPSESLESINLSLNVISIFGSIVKWWVLKRVYDIEITFFTKSCSK